MQQIVAKTDGVPLFVEELTKTVVESGLLTAVNDHYRATGAEIGRPYWLALLAEAYGKVGQPEEGLTVLAEAVAAADKTGER